MLEISRCGEGFHPEMTMTTTMIQIEPFLPKIVLKKINLRSKAGQLDNFLEGKGGSSETVDWAAPWSDI